MAPAMPKGMKVGAVSLWLLILLAERPMYGYEILRELEKRFSGYWKPKTGTIYPALEKLERDELVTSRIEFRGGAPDRKHYALTKRGQAELTQTMKYWTKMFQILEHYRAEHVSLFRYEGEKTRKDISQFLARFSKALDGRTAADWVSMLPGEVKKSVKFSPVDPIALRLLYAAEEDELEIILQLEWKPKSKSAKT